MKQIVLIKLVIIIYMMPSCYSDTSEFGGGSDSGQSGSLARFTIYQSYLYTLDENQLHTYDISETSNPISTSSSNYYSGLETVFAKDKYLYIGTQSGMLIFDLSVPDQPQHISTYQHVVSCDPVVVKGNYAFITLNSENIWCGRNVNELQVIDITDKNNPWKVSSYQMDVPKGLGIRDNLLFVCDDVLEVYNIENLPDIQFVQSFNISAIDVIPTNEVLIVVGNDALRQYRYNGDSISLLSVINFQNQEK